MNVLSYFTHEENVVALSISETHLSIARYTSRARVLEDTVRAHIELQKGIIVHGRVQDAVALGKALATLRRKFGGPRYCILTLPHAPIFTQTYPLPEHLTEEKLVEAALLAESWRTPFAENTAYVDSELFVNDTKRRATIMAAQHSDAEPFFAEVMRAGFIPVAAESELSAISRTLNDGAAQIITTFPHTDYTDIAVFSGTKLLLARSIPAENITSKKALDTEMQRISDYVEAAFGKAPTKRITQKLPFQSALREIFDNDETLREDIASWLPAFGALIRAKIRRRDDTLNSIYPLGTEEMYEYQKFFAFTSLMGTLTVLSGLVFLGAFIGMQYAATVLLGATAPRDDAALVSQVRAQIAEKETSFGQVNAAISTASILAKKEASFVTPLSLLRRMQIDGITLTKVSMLEVGKIQLVGTARSRAHLNAYRDGLAETPGIASAEVPVTGAELRADIPFTMTILLQDPQALYRGGKISTP